MTRAGVRQGRTAHMAADVGSMMTTFRGDDGGVVGRKISEVSWATRSCTICAITDPPQLLRGQRLAGLCICHR